MLGKHFEKLIQCDPRLNFLSQQPEVLLESPYFESRLPAFDEPDVSSHSKREEGAVSFDLQHAASPSGVQTSSSNIEQKDFIDPSSSSGKIMNLQLRFIMKQMIVSISIHLYVESVPYQIPAFLHVIILSSRKLCFLLTISQEVSSANFYGDSSCV